MVRMTWRHRNALKKYLQPLTEGYWRSWCMLDNRKFSSSKLSEKMCLQHLGCLKDFMKQPNKSMMILVTGRTLPPWKLLMRTTISFRYIKTSKDSLALSAEENQCPDLGMRKFMSKIIAPIISRRILKTQLDDLLSRWRFIRTSSTTWLWSHQLRLNWSWCSSS